MEIRSGLIHSSTEHVPSVNTALDPGNRAVRDGGGVGAALLVHPLQFSRQANEFPLSCRPQYRVLIMALTFTLFSVLGLKSVLPRGAGCKGAWEMKQERIADMRWVPSVGGDSPW